MPEDLYSDNPGGEAADTSHAPDKNKAGDSKGETFLVSKSALGDKEPKPGDICDFKCVRVYEDEAEFVYQKHEESDKESENPEMDSANSEMDTMAS